MLFDKHSFPGNQTVLPIVHTCGTPATVDFFTKQHSLGHQITNLIMVNISFITA